MFDSIEKISVRTVTWTWDKMNSYSFDQQPADLKISVTLRAAPEKVSELYSRFGGLETAVKQVVAPVRQSAGQDRVRALYRGPCHPGARRAQRRDP